VVFLLFLSACGLASALRALPIGSTSVPQLAQSPVLRASRLAMHVPPVTKAEANSFVQTEMRGAAMALHTKDQAPREGKQPAQKPVSDWQPGRAEYLQFLVDSREVYSTLEEIVETTPLFSSFAKSGLERSEALTKDIAWFAEEGLAEPPVAEYGREYATFLKSMVAEGRNEEFVCHFYNFYFAHTAGGRMIGKRMAQMLLDGRTLEFYQWSGGNVDKELLPALRSKIDAMVGGWTREQKDACIAETANSFKQGGALLAHLRSPPKK
jgi:heme oxygenase